MSSRAWLVSFVLAAAPACAFSVPDDEQSGSKLVVPGEAAIDASHEPEASGPDRRRQAAREPDRSDEAEPDASERLPPRVGREDSADASLPVASFADASDAAPSDVQADARAAVDAAAACVASERACDGDQPLQCSSGRVLVPHGQACAEHDLSCELGQCVEPGTALLGRASAGETFETLSANHFWATPLRTDSAASLRAFGIIGAVDDGLVRYALYEDDAGYPGELAALGLTQREVLAGPAEETAPIGFVPLAASTDYWLVIVSGANPPTIAVHGAGHDAGFIRRPFPAEHNFSSDFPAVFPGGGTTSPDASLGVYVRVRPQ